MMNEAGPDLDRQIERKLNGDAKKKTPPYSTSEKAASRLLRRLEMQDMPCSIEQIDGVWYCTFWIVLDSRERLATGSGETRALAIARAVMNARLGMGTASPAKSDEMSRRIHWATGERAPRRRGVVDARAAASRFLRVSAKRTNRLCTVCSWRKAKFPAGRPAGAEAITRPHRSEIAIDRGDRKTRAVARSGRRSGFGRGGEGLFRGRDARVQPVQALNRSNSRRITG